MAEIKTQKNKASVAAFIDAIADEEKRKDCKALMKLLKEVTGSRPAMWGTAIVGYGDYHYKYDSGREGNWFLAGFSPRKQALTLYIMSGLGHQQALLQKLGKFKHGKSCLYIKRLADVDREVLRELVSGSVQFMRGWQ